MKKRELYEKTKSELIGDVETLSNEMDLIKEEQQETQVDKGFRLYLGSSESTKRLKRRINFKFAIQSLISVGIFVGSIWMVSTGTDELFFAGLLLFIFGLVYYNQIMKNHVINILGACDLVIKKLK